MMKQRFFTTFLLLLLLSGNSFSANLSGDLKLYDQFGFPIVPPGLFPVTGTVDIDNNVLVIDDFLFFGLNTVTNVQEILPPGSYTREFNGIVINATIDPGNIGAYMTIEWNTLEIPLIMGWEVTSSNTIFTSVDVDGDGIPGMLITWGPFFGINATYDFTAEPVVPGVNLALTVVGGTIQECMIPGGSEVTINALPTVFGGAVLDSISWTIDGNDAGTGMVITEFLSLGPKSIQAVATTTTGETATASTTVTIRDTVRPELQIAFIDNQGQQVENAGPGHVEISMTATDICDPNPSIGRATATPASEVLSGDIVQINAGKDNLKLPITSLRVDATAADASGNVTSNSAILGIQ